MRAMETANDLGVGWAVPWTTVVRWSAVRAGEGYALTFEVPEGDGIRGARYVARMTTPAHSVLGGEDARSPAAALLALVEELREYEATGAEWFAE